MLLTFFLPAFLIFICWDLGMLPTGLLVLSVPKVEAPSRPCAGKYPSLTDSVTSFIFIVYELSFSLHPFQDIGNPQTHTLHYTFQRIHKMHELHGHQILHCVSNTIRQMQ